MLAGTAALCLTVTSYLALISDDYWGGRVIWVVSPGHGVHLGDVPLVVAWLLGVCCCVALGRRRR